jgi:cephalosporin hydroxylase
LRRAVAEEDPSSGALRSRVQNALAAAADVIAAFHRCYYLAAADTWANTHWLGTPAQKWPLDLWIYQEILVETRPGLIVETGTAAGGSASSSPASATHSAMAKS